MTKAVEGERARSEGEVEGGRVERDRAERGNGDVRMKGEERRGMAG